MDGGGYEQLSGGSVSRVPVIHLGDHGDLGVEGVLQVDLDLLYVKEYI